MEGTLIKDVLDERVVAVIDSYEPLRNWFIRNDIDLYSYEILPDRGVQYFKSFSSNNIKALEMMAIAAYRGIMVNLPMSNKDKAKLAVHNMIGVYYHEKEYLNEVAVSRLKIIDEENVRIYDGAKNKLAI